ncbi:cbb3-type cytochrome oxidase assembly protein [Heliophilum fasciatum]|uniref:Cbb3-type cytochrome oxidase maturation protein n=1 Tax=Heliophilum fasciatum TaxID=35700 RepID=A0A4R2RIS9_9FIRM|nr:cbb3-type cytochrome oxidase assembly protein [Heliophilum fasciatum]MCW2278914.1 cbb3-type cytochrome oxidase maturation protein [Heliophilum fasciatum]TCP62047.1 cbb3-type cytochrome oxidase maturation protein [Heliophilum fasciatum]
MTASMWLITLFLVSSFGGILCVFWWAKRDGQFENVEDIKYRMLHDD